MNKETGEHEVDNRVSIPQNEAKDFGIRMAKTIKDNGSSYCFFILQMAYPENADDWEWSDYMLVLDKILSEGATQ